MPASQHGSLAVSGATAGTQPVADRDPASAGRAGSGRVHRESRGRGISGAGNGMVRVSTHPAINPHTVMSTNCGVSAGARPPGVLVDPHRQLGSVHVVASQV